MDVCPNIFGFPAHTNHEVKNMNIFETDEDDFLDTPIVSSMECTGLIPALPETDEELEAYEEMFPYLTPPSSKDPEIS